MRLICGGTSLWDLPAKLCMPTFLLIALLLFWPGNASAQQNLELGGGYAHSSGDFGLNGFNAGAAWWFTPKITIAADYDNMYNTSRIGTFEFTSIGPIVIKSHLQDFLFGPRIFFSSRKVEKRDVTPFVEAQFGLSHLNSTVRQISSTFSGADTAFSWMLGGGADYRLNSHWTARGKLDLLRTHLNDQGQSRVRLALGVTYTFGGK
jgi:opacity protein-like surface antigen